MGVKTIKDYETMTFIIRQIQNILCTYRYFACNSYFYALSELKPITN